MQNTLVKLHDECKKNLVKLQTGCKKNLVKLHEVCNNSFDKSRFKFLEEIRMFRDITKKLNAWKKLDHRKPLVLRGARQVGKTWSVEDFGKRNFSNVVVVDFERNRSVHKVFENDLDPEKIVQDLEIQTGQMIKPGETLLFFDEIQESERAIASLRYFYEEMPELHLIAAGSLLEFAINFHSFPVGRVTFEWMRPMTFQEFLIASGKQVLAEKIPSVFEDGVISDVLHEKLMEQLKSYFIVGGMPEAVKMFIETGSYNEVRQIHEDMVISFVQSLAKYNTRTDIESIEQVMRTVSSNVGQQVKYTRLDPDRRVEVIKKSVNILEKALIIHPVRAVDVSGLPLGAHISSKVFKSLFLDIGLMQSICGLDPLQSIDATDLTSVYKGSLAEQFVGQELLAAGGSESNKVFYWNRAKKSSTAEVDFVIVRNGEIFPIEVKSGPSGKMKSMHLLLKEYPEISKGFVLSSKKHDEQRLDNMKFYPMYFSLG